MSAGGICQMENDFWRRGLINRPMQMGKFHSTSVSRGIKVNRLVTAAFRVYGDDGGAVIWGSGSVPDIKGMQSRYMLTEDNTGGHIRAFGLMGQLKGYDAKWNTEQVGAVYGRLELVRSATTMTLGGYGISASGAFTVATSGAITVDTNHILAGVLALADFRATLTQTGKTAAFLAAKYDTTNWSDSTARTTWGYGLYVPPGAITTGAILIGTSSASPMLITSTGTTNMIDVNGKVTAASATYRGIVSYAEFSGTNIGVATNLYAIRGYAKVSGTAAGSNTFYSAGVQGKLELAGTISGGKHAALLGQFNASAGAAAGTGTMYAVWADAMQLAAKPGLYSTMFGAEMPDGTLSIDSAMYVYGKATYLLDLQGPTTDYLATVATAPAAATGSLKINTPSGVRYLLLTDDPTA